MGWTALLKLALALAQLALHILQSAERAKAVKEGEARAAERALELFNARLDRAIAAGRDGVHKPDPYLRD